MDKKSMVQRGTTCAGRQKWQSGQPPFALAARAARLPATLKSGPNLGSWSITSASSAHRKIILQTVIDFEIGTARTL